MDLESVGVLEDVRSCEYGGERACGPEGGRVAMALSTEVCIKLLTPFGDA